MNKTMKNMPKDFQPYEKCVTFGPESMNDSELLAVILKSGTRGKNAVELAGELIERAGGTIQGLHALTIQEMQELSGIGAVKAVQLSCLLELSKRLAREKNDGKQCFLEPEKVAAYYMESCRHKTQEELIAVFLDARGHRIKDKMISRGSVTASQVPIREILVEALSAHAVQMLLLHNHPSGDPTPSAADIRATRDVSMIAQLAGIPLLDHIIIGDRKYRSLFKEGLLE